MVGPWVHLTRIDFARLVGFVRKVIVLRNRLLVVLLLAIWFAATQHCGLENLGLFAANAEKTTGSSCCKGNDDSCTRDGCDTVESGSYKPDRDLKLATPQFVACACQICLKAILPLEPRMGMCCAGISSAPMLGRLRGILCRERRCLRAPFVESGLIGPCAD